MNENDGLVGRLNDSGGVFFDNACQCGPCRVRGERLLYFFPRPCSFCGSEQYCRKLSRPYEEAIYACWTCFRAMSDVSEGE